MSNVNNVIFNDMEKETPRQIALRTYKKQIELGLKETPQSWFLWKRAFNIAHKEFKNNVALHSVVGSKPMTVELKFGVHLKAEIQIENSNIKYIRGVNGWGDIVHQNEFESRIIE